MACAVRCVFQIAQRLGDAGIRDAGVEHRHVGKSDSEAAKRHRQARNILRRKGETRTRVLQRQGEAQRTDAIQHHHRRHVQRHAQRIARGHRALEAAGEIFWRVIAKGGRLILHHGGGMQDEIVERETVDEGLERRTRRAGTPRQIDLAALAPVIGAADIGEHVARFVVDHDNGERGVIVEIGALLHREAFDGSLQVGVDIGFDARRLGGRHQMISQMRRDHRHGEADRGHAFMLGNIHIALRDDAFRDHAVENLLAPCDGGEGVTIRAQARGRLRQRHQHRAFGKIERFRFLVEIGQRGRTHAFQIAAEGRQREIDRKDLVFRIALFELHGAHHLERLGDQPARTPRPQQPRSLHGERGRAGNDATRTEILRGGTDNRGGIDAEMLVEMLVLVCLENLQVARVHIAHLGLETPVAILRQERPQQGAVTRDNFRRQRVVARHVRRIGAVGRG